MNNLDNLFSHWKNEPSIILNEGLSSSDLKLFESNYSVCFPDIFYSYLAQINGFSQSSSEDSQGFYFFELNDFQTVDYYTNGISTNNKYVVFCDYLSGSWWYAICLDSASPVFGKIFLVDGSQEPLKVISDDFSEFIEIYVNNSPQVYGR